LSLCLPYVKANFRDYTIYDPACGHGEITGFFAKEGFKTVGTDLFTTENKLDFLNDSIDHLKLPKKPLLICAPPITERFSFLDAMRKLPYPFIALVNSSCFARME
jgi:hypothetical protein